MKDSQKTIEDVRGKDLMTNIELCGSAKCLPTALMCTTECWIKAFWWDMLKSTSLLCGIIENLAFRNVFYEV